MLKLFCDRCGKEIDRAKENYFGITMNDVKAKFISSIHMSCVVAQDSNDREHWDICHECASFIRSVMLNGKEQK